MLDKKSIKSAFESMLYIWGECYAEEMEKNLKKLLGNAFDEDAFDEMVTQICSSE